MRSNAYIKIKSRIYEHANILTWLVVIFIVSLALGVRGYNSEEAQSLILLFMPIFALLAIVLIVFTQSALKFIGNLFSYVFVGLVCFSVTMSSIAYSPSGLLSGVWLTTILAGVFGTLALSYLIKSAVNVHHVVALNAFINIAVVLLSLFTFAYINPNSEISLEILALRLVMLGFITSLIVSFVVIFISARAYKTSFSKNKVLAKDWLKNKEYASSSVEDILSIVSKNDYTAHSYVFNGHKSVYAFKGDSTVVFVPLEVVFKETEMTKSLAKNAKVRKKTFDNIIVSVINRFSGVFTMPPVPMLVVFVVPKGTINRVVVHKTGHNNFSDSLLFMPTQQISTWLEDVEAENSHYIAVFPELSQKATEKRELFYKELTGEVKSKKERNKSAKSKKKTSVKIVEHTDVSTVNTVGTKEEKETPK